jgi:hypothetical protein
MFVIAVVVALIGAVSGIAGTVISVRSQRRVTYLSSSLEEQRAESDARRAYEYEARKRLYEVYEPLRLRLLECTDNAVAEMDRLVGQAGPGRPGFSSAEYQVTAAVYFLLAPLAVSRMIERRLTLVDLSLDKRIYTEFVLAQRICRSVSESPPAAALHPLRQGLARQATAVPAAIPPSGPAAGAPEHGPRRLAHYPAQRRGHPDHVR